MKRNCMATGILKRNNRIIFMGSSDFSLNSLKKLYENEFNVVAVYTRAPQPTGRGYKIKKTVVHEYAEDKSISVYTPKTLRDEKQEEIFTSLNSDLVVVSSYGLIIPENILNKSIFINIHASLLPRWRGASPIQSAILAGDRKTGISIMKMDAGLDTGDVISMKSVDISSKTTYGELSKILADLGAEMVLDTITNLEESLKYAKKQNEECACYAHKISKDMAEIDWSKSCKEVLKLIKAFSPTPSAWTMIDNKRIKIIDASLVKSGEDISKDFVMKCFDGFLRLDLVQPEGKKTMNGCDFVRGHQKMIRKG